MNAGTPDCAIAGKPGTSGVGFSLLTANPYVLQHPQVITIAERLGVETPQIIFRFAMQAGMVPLTGTTNLEHMKEDLKVYDIELTPGEVKLIESIEG